MRQRDEVNHNPLVGGSNPSVATIWPPDSALFSLDKPPGPGGAQCALAGAPRKR